MSWKAVKCQTLVPLIVTLENEGQTVKVPLLYDRQDGEVVVVDTVCQDGAIIAAAIQMAHEKAGIQKMIRPVPLDVDTIEQIRVVEGLSSRRIGE